MKARQNFVVEFKSNRRQLKPRTNSIWGDTDLKAIAEAVSDELPSSGDGFNTSQEGERSPDVIALSNSDMPERHQATNDQSSPAIQDFAAIGLTSSTLEPDETATPVQREDRLGIQDAKLEGDQSSHDSPKPQHLASDEASSEETTRPKPRPTAELSKPEPDETATLEAENRRLRALWKAKLKTENEKLKAMLARLS